ncbi:MAG: DUF1624 domain-containing protein [Rubrobacter sp.]|nr:DUF1624 domain-containing protein [Rubrobacter sp.]
METAKHPRPRRARLGGLDAARALAVLGMVMAHFGPTPMPESLGGDVYGVVLGRASILFALLAGVGGALLSRGRSGWRARGRLVVRGALLLPIGLWLQGLDHGVLVILQYYAVYFLLAALVLGLSSRWLFVCAAAAFVLGPLVYVAIRDVSPEWFVEDPATLGDPFGNIVGDILLSGAYPLVTWSAPLLFGMWLGSRNLRAVSTRLWMLWIGLAAALAAPYVSNALVARYGETLVGPPRNPENAGLSNLLSADAHSQMPLWMLGAVGAATATLAAALLIADLLPKITWPLVATGQLALTVYVGHLILLHANEELLRRETVPEATFTVAAFMLSAILVCTLWRLVLPRGPLEAALSAPWWAVERLFRAKGGNPKSES